MSLKAFMVAESEDSTKMHTHMCLCICEITIHLLTVPLLPTFYSGRIAGHHLCTYIHTYIYSHMHTNVCIGKHVYMYRYTYVYMYMYTYVYIEKHGERVFLADT